VAACDRGVGVGVWQHVIGLGVSVVRGSDSTRRRHKRRLCHTILSMSAPQPLHVSSIPTSVTHHCASEVDSKACHLPSQLLLISHLMHADSKVCIAHMS